MRCGPELKRSIDEGESWQSVPRPGSLNQWASNVGADGSLFLAIQRDSYPYANRLVKLDGATGAMSGWDLPMEPAAVASDQQGRVWVAWCSWTDPDFQVQLSRIHMARVDGDGAVADEASRLADGSSCSLSLNADLEDSLYLTSSTYTNNGPTQHFRTHFAPQGSHLVVRSAPVLYDKDGLVVTVDGTRVDGGPTFGAAPVSWGSGFFVFRGYESVGDGVWQEVQPGRLAARVPRIPQARVTATPQGAFIDGASVLAYMKSPPGPPAGDAVPGDLQSMLTEANRLPQQLGLEPLVSDARVAQAARSHSRYWTLNDPAGVGLRLHDEAPGKPGFTGASPSDRCLHAGYPESCGEVMFPGVDPVGAVRGWIATAFHRSWLVHPGAFRVGGAKYGDGPVVMNAGGDYSFLGRPFGYPVGDYALALGFSGELPDPAESLCPGKISAPYGAAVTVNTPSSMGGSNYPAAASPFEVQSWTVIGPNGRVKGCFREGTFVPDDALEPGSDYRVTVEWGDPGQPAHSWTFHTVGEPPTPKKRSARPGKIKILKKKVGKRNVILKWKKAKRATGYQVRVTRPGGKKFKKWKEQQSRALTKRLKRHQKYKVKIRATDSAKKGPVKTVKFRAR